MIWYRCAALRILKHLYLDDIRPSPSVGYHLCITPIKIFICFMNSSMDSDIFIYVAYAFCFTWFVICIHYCDLAKKCLLFFYLPFRNILNTFSFFFFVFLSLFYNALCIQVFIVYTVYIFLCFIWLPVI